MWCLSSPSFAIVHFPELRCEEQAYGAVPAIFDCVVCVSSRPNAMVAEVCRAVLLVQCTELEGSSGLGSVKLLWCVFEDECKGSVNAQC